MISFAVACRNEADKLGDCLKSVQGFADELLVLDLESVDETREVCKKYGAKIIRSKGVEFVELVRDYLIKRAAYDWVLLLDPDERINEKLKKRLRDIKKLDLADAVNIPRKNIFFGKWIAHTNFWPDRQIRFFKKDKIYWPKKIHTYPKVSGKVLDLEVDADLAIEHYGYQTYREFLIRQMRYAKVEAENIIKDGGGFSLINLIWKPLREFLVRFIKYGAYLDGKDGIFLVFGLMFTQVLIQIYLLKFSNK